MISQATHLIFTFERDFQLAQVHSGEKYKDSGAPSQPLATNPTQDPMIIDSDDSE